MTKIQGERIIRRETAASDRKRPIVVTLFPWFCGVNLKGSREFFAVPWDAVLDLGRKIDAREKNAGVARKRA